jgi:sugar/nucleoside kinase (ribokinase family)
MGMPRIRPRRLVLVGSILVDILMYVDRLPERGGDSIAKGAVLTSGGGFNVLVAAARLGMPVAYAGRVGDGPMGTQVMADLTAVDIPLLLPRVSGEDTGFDIGLVESDAERTFVTAPGAESRLSLADLNALQLFPGDAIYISGYDLCYPVSGAALEVWLPSIGDDYLLVIDPGPLVAEIPAERLARVLHRTDLLSLNARESHLLTGAQEPSNAATQFAPLIAPDGWIIARAGAQGCWVADRNHAPMHLPARRTQPVDTTGAGDTHVAALLARLAAGDDIYAAARIANVAASLSTERQGPATGPTAQEVSAALSQHLA